MKLSCTRENLRQGLSITSHLTSKNVNLPVLQNVLVKADGGTIRFTTTNLEIAVSCTVRGKVESGGEFTVPSKLFFDYVSLLPNETVTVEGSGAALAVSCGGNKTRMNGLPASEFPLVPEVSATRAYRIPVESFRQALSQVLFAVATNESRPELAGVSVRFEAGTNPSLTLAATDSYRLAEASLKLPGGSVEGDSSFIIPSRTLGEVNRILAVFKDEVEAPTEIILKLSDNQAVFSYGSVELVSRLIDGNYPDYRQIIPKSFQTQAVLDRDDFAKAVKTASLFSRTGLFDVTLEFDPAAKKLRVKATDAARGENTAECEADATGNENKVTVNYRYLLDGLNAMGSDQVLFKMIDAGNPCVIQPAEGSNYLYIVMPIKQ
ncbi:DNA polymerase III subunit beta [Candidatus Uhrbacteria bacterium RIFCSPHIGHO2_01_FULL_63_20]|uniref:Beta sliding clamp n=1 Tax=Candidatus Uhrbacteria bacterium RIFCSPHIGHO2_01_FULL_63_20 TaxID=1802385 RepID=A0A1F7TN43_9BACT|nr:MAG: DNA polymerase III subunit beta [Candidatus Uhrbacteria bacterium RIFCSPHIGHO2_01_FULL_63_20]